MKESPRKSAAPLLTTIGVVLIHIIVIGLVIWGCNSGSKPKIKGRTEEQSGSSAGTEAVADSGNESPETPPEASSTGPKSKPGNSTKATKPSPADLGAVGWKGTGIIVDMDTHKVLWEHNSKTPVPIASMAKMMTVLLVAEELERGNPDFTLNTKLKFSESARLAIHVNERKSGALSKRKENNLQVGDEITVHDLLRATLIKSANDAANLLAEKLGGGSVDAFIAKMNNRAKELGFKSMVFYTANGLNSWRGKEVLVSQASAADMVRIAELLMKHKVLRDIVGRNSATIVIKRGRQTLKQEIKSTNALLKDGAEGIKTGHTNKAGWCLTFSVKRNGKRVIGCVTGFEGARPGARDAFCRRLINWAYDPASLTKPAPKPKGGKRGAAKSGSIKKSRKTKAATKPAETKRAEPGKKSKAK